MSGYVAPGVEHGVLSTYTNHGCRCDACRAACRDYTRTKRTRDPATVEANRNLVAARQAALRRLALAHWDEYQALYAEEKAARLTRPRAVRAAQEAS